jgi:hypothetical protein
MASPEPYRDDDRPPWGSPRLYGDVAGLGGKPTGTLRHRKPSESSARRMHQMLIIAACHDAGLSAKIVARTLDLSDRHVRRIYLLKTKAEATRRP